MRRWRGGHPTAPNLCAPVPQEREAEARLALQSALERVRLYDAELAEREAAVREALRAADRTRWSAFVASKSLRARLMDSMEEARAKTEECDASHAENEALREELE